MQEARKISETGSSWVNAVPHWIHQHAAMKPKPKQKIAASTLLHVVQGMANAGKVDRHGNITGIIGGGKLARSLRMSKNTLNRYITYLTRHELVIVQSRGGPVGRRGDGGTLRPYNAANVYALPRREGALSGVRRRRQTMKPTGERHHRQLNDGTIISVPTYAPDVTKPGDQSTIWPQPGHNQPSPAAAGYAPAGAIGDFRTTESTTTRTPKSTKPEQFRDTTPVSPGHYPSVPRTHQNHPCDHPLGEKNHGRARPMGGGQAGGTKRARGVGGRSGVWIRDERTLHDPIAMLAMFRDLARRKHKSIRGVTAEQFLGAAVRAIDVQRAEGGDVAAIFGSIVNRGLWLYITEAQLERARTMLQVITPREELRHFRSFMAIAKNKGVSVFLIAKAQWPDIDRTRCDELEQEVNKAEQAGAFG